VVVPYHGSCERQGKASASAGEWMSGRRTGTEGMQGAPWREVPWWPFCGNNELQADMASAISTGWLQRSQAW
jgi:hypothetical protein